MNVLIFTKATLDGACSALFIKWLYNRKIEDFAVVEATETNILNEVNIRQRNFDHYDKIFVLGLCLTGDQIKEIDKHSLIVVDHQFAHTLSLDNYNKSKGIIEQNTSCISLLYDKFKSVIDVSPEQELLIKYVDDYDSFNLKYSDSFKLSAIFFTYNNPKVVKFIESFENGMRKYTIQEKNAIKIYIRKFKEQLDNTVNFGTIKNYKTVAIFANTLINNIAHYIISKHNSEIGIVVNLDTKSVSFRRCIHCDIDVSILAKTFCEGSGTMCAAGGKLTPEFANLIKDFKPC